MSAREELREEIAKVVYRIAQQERLLASRERREKQADPVAEAGMAARQTRFRLQGLKQKLGELWVRYDEDIISGHLAQNVVLPRTSVAVLLDREEYQVPEHIEHRMYRGSQQEASALMDDQEAACPFCGLKGGMHQLEEPHQLAPGAADPDALTPSEAALLSQHDLARLNAGTGFATPRLPPVVSHKFSGDGSPDPTWCVCGRSISEHLYHDV